MRNSAEKNVLKLSFQRWNGGSPEVEGGNYRRGGRFIPEVKWGEILVLMAWNIVSELQVTFHVKKHSRAFNIVPELKHLSRAATSASSLTFQSREKEEIHSDSVSGLKFFAVHFLHRRCRWWNVNKSTQHRAFINKLFRWNSTKNSRFSKFAVLVAFAQCSVQKLA